MEFEILWNWASRRTSTPNKDWGFIFIRLFVLPIEAHVSSPSVCLARLAHIIESTCPHETNQVTRLWGYKDIRDWLLVWIDIDRIVHLLASWISLSARSFGALVHWISSSYSSFFLPPRDPDWQPNWMISLWAILVFAITWAAFNRSVSIQISVSKLFESWCHLD